MQRYLGDFGCLIQLRSTEIRGHLRAGALGAASAIIFRIRWSSSKSIPIWEIAGISPYCGNTDKALLRLKYPERVKETDSVEQQSSIEIILQC